MAETKRDELARLIRQVDDLSIATDCGAWIFYPGLVSQRPWDGGPMWREEPPEPQGAVDYESAIENLRQLATTWGETLASPLIAKVYGRVAAASLGKMISDGVRFAEDAGSLALFGSGPRTAERYAGAAIELSRAWEVASQNARPFIANLKAALDVSAEAGATRPRPRRDDPDEDEVALARQICRANPKITRDALAHQMEIGGNKASRLLKILQNEGIHQGRSRRRTKEIE